MVCACAKGTHSSSATKAPRINCGSATISPIEASADPGLLRVTVWVALQTSRGRSDPVPERAVTSLTGFIGVGPGAARQ